MHFASSTSPTPPISLVSSLCSIAGSFFLWLAWFRLPRVINERAKLSVESGDEGRRTVPEKLTAQFGASGGASLSVLAFQVLERAQKLAESQCGADIETDHILRCLLEGPRGAGKLIVGDILAGDKDVRSRLEDAIRGARQTPIAAVSNTSAQTSEWRITMKLSDRAQQALEFARLEAHRFESEYVGAEHLLLGVLLMGVGDGVVALFQKGVTVDAVRGRMIRNRSIARAAR